MFWRRTRALEDHVCALENTMLVIVEKQSDLMMKMIDGMDKIQIKINSLKDKQTQDVDALSSLYSELKSDHEKLKCLFNELSDQFYGD